MSRKVKVRMIRNHLQFLDGHHGASIGVAQGALLVPDDTFFEESTSLYDGPCRGLYAVMAVTAPNVTSAKEKSVNLISTLFAGGDFGESG